MEDPPEEASFPDLLGEAEMWKRAGVSFGEEGTYLLYLSLKKLAVRLREPGAAPLRSLRPSAARLMASHDGSLVTGVSVTTSGCQEAGGEEGVSGPDFHSRYFAPWNGIPEDPVVFSAC